MNEPKNMLSTNWSTYFKSRLDNETGNYNTMVYSNAWSSSTTNSSKLALLTNDPNTIIFAAKAEGTMIPLHSFANLGGSVLRPNNKVICLTSSGRVGVVVIVDEQSVTGKCKFTSPPTDIIIARNSPAEMQAIPTSNVSAGGGTEYAGCNTFLPAPWLVDVVLGSPTNDPFELIILTCAAAEAFDAATMMILSTSCRPKTTYANLPFGRGE